MSEEDLKPRKRGKRLRPKEHTSANREEFGPLGTRVAAAAPLYVKCIPCQENPDRSCAFCTDGYIETGYTDTRLDQEVDRGDRLLILLAEIRDGLKEVLGRIPGFPVATEMVQNIEAELNAPVGTEVTSTATQLEAAHSRQKSGY